MLQHDVLKYAMWKRARVKCQRNGHLGGLYRKSLRRECAVPKLGTSGPSGGPIFGTAFGAFDTALQTHTFLCCVEACNCNWNISKLGGTIFKI